LQLYSLPQGGNIKLYKELQCPLDGFELLLFQVGPEGGALKLLRCLACRGQGNQSNCCAPLPCSFILVYHL
jgi:DNA topoisomerase-3